MEQQGLDLSAFTHFLTHLPGLHWWQSLGGDRYAFAPACYRLLNIHQEVTPQEWQWRLHPNDRSKRAKALKLAPDQETTLEYRIQTADGTYQWVQESIRNTQAADEGYILLSTAVTCKEPVYRAMFNNTSLFMVLTDPEGNIQELNSTSEAIIGQEWEQVYGQPLLESPCFLHQPEDAATLKAALDRAAAGEIVHLQEWRLSYRNFSFFGNFVVRYLLNPKGVLEYLLIEGSDISHQKRVDQQLKVLAESIPDLIIRLDPQLRIRYTNPAIETFSGKKPDQFIGKPVSQAGFPLQDMEAFEAKLQQLLQQQQMFTYTGTCSTSSGEPRHIYSLLVPEVNERQEITSILTITRDVTELIKKEKALKRNNAKLRAIIEGTSDIICAFDTDQQLLVFNAAYQQEVKRIYGKEVVLNLSLSELLAANTIELKNAQDIWNRALQGEEFTILQEFGSLERNYYEISFSSIRDEEGTLIGASCRSRNISTEYRVEKELKDAKEFLILAENLPQIIFTARPNGHIDYFNAAFFDYTNQPSTSPEYLNWKKVLHPEDYNQVLQQWLEAVQNNIPGLQLELRLRNRHGLYRWHVARAVPILNKENKPVKWVGAFNDIHEAKIAGEVERMAADEFKTIAESLPHIVWTTRANGGATYFNNKWYDYTGEDPHIINEWDWTKFLHSEDRTRTHKTWEKAISTHTNYQVEYRLRHKSGRYRWFMARGVPVTDSQGNITKWFGTCTDIHENKLQRKRLQTQNDRLNQINRYLDNFVHAAAHDLRSPVANLKGLLQLLQQAAGPDSNKLLESMETSLYRLDNTLQAMIHSIELQSLKQSPAKALNLKEVFNLVHQEFTDRLQTIPHELQLSLDSCPDLVFIPFYLESLFRNLLSNAIKYRRMDQKLIIQIKCRTYRSFKLLEFSDNGIGIDVERYKEKLFQPFQRFTQQAPGKGIGLHLINNIVTKTGGKLEVKSTLGQGTTFFMYLKDLELN